MRAAILIAKFDNVSSREACRLTDVSPNAHSRVSALAARVKALLHRGVEHVQETGAAPHHPNSSHGKLPTELEELRARFADASEPDSEELRRRQDYERTTTGRRPNYGRDGPPLRMRLRSIDRPHTLMAEELANEITPAQRDR